MSGYSDLLPQWELDAMEAYTKEAEQERESFKMSNEVTKACSLTEIEIEELMMYHGRNLGGNTGERLERMNYLYKRLKSFKENDKAEDKSADANANQPIEITPASPWPSNG